MSEEGIVLDLAGPVLLAGAPLARAAAAMVMIHGRGATARDILTNVPGFHDPDFAYLAPQAPDNAWYPRPFSALLQENEPYLSASLAVVSDVLAYLTTTGIPPERVVLFGFSQGACLGICRPLRPALRRRGWPQRRADRPGRLATKRSGIAWRLPDLPGVQRYRSLHP